MVRATVVTATRYMGLGQGQIDALITALGEAYRNAVEHGNRADAFVPVVVRLRDEGRALAVDIVDRGPGFSPPAHVQGASGGPAQGTRMM